jgi:PAS domain S-box-containing protein
MRTADGTYRGNLVLAEPVVDEAGELTSWVGTSTDIHEQKVAEQRLRETVARLDALQETAPAGIAFVDTNGVVMRANAALARLTGSPASTLIGRPLADTLPHPPEAAAGALRDVLADGPPVVDMPVAAGALYLLESFFPVRVEGALAGVGVVVHDATEQMRMQRELLAVEKMAVACQMAGGIAHDFSNLLAAVTMTAETALGRELSATERDDFNRILDASRVAVRLTQQLDVLSRQQAVEPTLVDVGRALDEMEDLLRRTAGPDRELDVIRDTDLPPVLIDRAQLEQVVMNLVVNGRDATDDGGRIVVRLHRVADENPPAVELAVADDGSGMAPVVAARAREPFFTTKGNRGTGLGLAIVEAIAAQTRGQVTIDTAPGAGTTVRVSLPAVVHGDNDR